jgi:putative transcriptional regulator
MDMAARFRLAELLEGAGLSQRELAQRADVSPTTVNRMAKNLTAQVSLKTLDALSRELKCEPGDLIERAPERAAKGRGKR